MSSIKTDFNYHLHQTMKEESFMDAAGSEKNEKQVFILKGEEVIKEQAKTKIMNVN